MSEAANDPLAHELETNGYAIVRGVFDADEVSRLRQLAARHLATGGVPQVFGRVQPNAAVEIPALSWLFASDKVLSLFRRALRTDDIVFTGHADVQRDLRSGWHKDSGHGPGDYFNGDYFGASNCRVYKLALYLEDHVDTGLSVQPATHHDAAIDRNALGLPLASKAGDAILFDVRLTHGGQRRDVVERFLADVVRRLRVGPSVLSWLHDRYLGRPDRRYSIFFTFGVPNAFTEDFAAGNMRRQLEQTASPFKPLPAALKAELERRGVRIAAALSPTPR
ncbi:MAG: phytanoyl-CoA dioxygenase family protein [Alphaproteobacteria bacterium]|nr:phytanoyl-CoA dioxygenase family protein [Alphaproteobacteria bacterium]